MAKLSYMKIGKKEFFLEVGDEFFSNGLTYLVYQPKGKVNKDKCGRYNDMWHTTTTIEVTKAYREAILNGKCTNLEMIEEKKIDGGNGICYRRTWRVISIDKVNVEKPELGELWYIGIGISGGSFSNDKRGELFTIHIGKIKERTEKQIVLEADLHYIRKWNTTETLNKMMSKSRWGSDRLSGSDDFGVFMEVPADVEPEAFEALEEWKDKLYQAMKGKLESELKLAENNLASFKLLAEKVGY